VRGAYETVDGTWRVEVVQERGEFFYRVIHGDETVGRLPIASVQRILAEGGVDMADMVEASDTEAPPAA
jgi:bifunctional non-homologous end joining protein LigD